MKITTLTDNASNNENLFSEHGLSIYIETENHKILFDTGKSDIFLKNDQKLKIDLREVDVVVISHAHYDHLGGLIYFMQLNSKAKIYLKKEIFDYQYQSVRNGIAKEIGYSNELEGYKSRFTFLKDDILKDGNLCLFSKIEKEYPIPKGNKLLFKYNDKTNEADDFQHELIFVIDTSDGLCIFSGCAHNGILNMLHTVKKYFPDKSIQLIYGGLHLIDSNKFVTTETNEELIDIAFEFDILSAKAQLYTGHCTGENATTIMKKILNKRLHHFYTGHKIEI
jgi:7,8-dihydropterin-6-yl-methyl-4-(beta-D-ribofuranosyl)aminobenzene 5'-phosphate synthase